MPKNVRSEYQIWNDEINGVKTPLIYKILNIGFNLAGVAAFAAIVLIVAFVLKVF